MSDPAPNAADRPTSSLAARLEDLLHVGVGLSILAFQKAQVHRQDLSKALREQLGPATDAVRDHVKVVEERLAARRER